MASFLLQVVIFQFLFLLVYETLLKKETFFTWNRWYLLVTAVVSLVLPFIEIEMLSFWLPQENISNTSQIFPQAVIDAALITASTTPPGTTATELNINWWIVSYITGAGICLYLFLGELNNLSRLFRFKTIASEEDFRIIEVPNSTIACTFFKTVFLGDQLSEAEKQQILSHELVHVKQKHSLDLMFFEALKIIFWFNPLIYIYQSRIAALHEFIADAQVVKSTTKRSYYEQLLNSAFSTKSISFINQFISHSLIKKRIIMLQRSQSRTVAKLKYLAMLPLMLLMLSFVAYQGTGVDPVYKAETNAPLVEGGPVNQQLEMPFAVVEQIPIYPGCEAMTKEEGRECFSMRIKDYVMRNYNTVTVKPYLNEGSNRLFLVFTIDANGEVTGVKSRMVTPGIPVEYKAEIEKEANRVALTIPKMKPGMHDGREVGVLYSLPLEIFNTGDVD